VCAVDWIAGTRTDSISSNDIAVANLSGNSEPGDPEFDDGNCGLSNDDALHAAICRATSMGIVWVNSAGNESSDVACCVPGGYDEVLTVTAMGDYDGRPGALAPAMCGDLDDKADFDQDDDEASWFSNFGTLAADRDHTVSAPGVCLRAPTRLANCEALGPKKPKTCVIREIYGTSFAAPLVTGTVALCIHSGRCAGLTSAQIIDKIRADAAGYNQANPSYGFQGDPLRPISGKYYGYLVRAGLY
jgi:hypothetical protein